MLVKVFATKPEGFWWKAPSWSEGRGFSMESAVDLDLEEADLQALKDHVAAGFWLRYELIEAPKPVTDKADKKK